MPSQELRDEYNGEPFVFENFIRPELCREDMFYRSSNNYDRSFDEYGYDFCLDFRMFAGKCVLDLGAGYMNRFARQATEHGVRVISVNPNWRDDRYQNDARRDIKKSSDGQSVAATAQHLPFQSESFDAVVSSWSIPMYLPGTVGEYICAFSEIDRVLKPEGVGILYPILKDLDCNPSFEYALEKSVSAYKILKGVIYSRLLLYKEITSNNGDLIDKISNPEYIPTHQEYLERAKLLRKAS